MSTPFVGVSDGLFVVIVPGVSVGVIVGSYKGVGERMLGREDGDGLPGIVLR